jgi:hypothetical protein
LDRSMVTEETRKPQVTVQDCSSQAKGYRGKPKKVSVKARFFYFDRSQNLVSSLLCSDSSHLIPSHVISSHLISSLTCLVQLPAMHAGAGIMAMNVLRALALLCSALLCNSGLTPQQERKRKERRRGKEGSEQRAGMDVSSPLKASFTQSRVFSLLPFTPPLHSSPVLYMFLLHSRSQRFGWVATPV